MQSTVLNATNTVQTR